MLLLALDILVVRLRGKRVIWTIHNLVSHESNNPEWEIKARRVIARTCSHALLHSHSALKLVEKTYHARSFGQGLDCGARKLRRMLPEC